MAHAIPDWRLCRTIIFNEYLRNLKREECDECEAIIFRKGLLSKENAAEELGVSVGEFEKMVNKEDVEKVQET